MFDWPFRVFLCSPAVTCHVCQAWCGRSEKNSIPLPSVGLPWKLKARLDVPCKTSREPGKFPPPASSRSEHDAGIAGVPHFPLSRFVTGRIAGHALPQQPWVLWRAAEFSGYVSAVVGFPDRATAPHGIVLTWYNPIKQKRQELGHDRGRPYFQGIPAYLWDLIPGKCAGNGGLCQRVYCAHLTELSHTARSDFHGPYQHDRNREHLPFSYCPA